MGSGTPKSQSNAPLPNPMTISSSNDARTTWHRSIPFPAWNSFFAVDACCAAAPRRWNHQLFLPYAADEKLLRAHDRKVASCQSRSGLQEMPQARGRRQRRQTWFESRTQGQGREEKPAAATDLDELLRRLPEASGRHRECRYLAPWRISTGLGSQLDVGRGRRLAGESGLTEGTAAYGHRFPVEWQVSQRGADATRASRARQPASAISVTNRATRRSR